MITIAIQCYNFQRRLCWMLNSFLQQTIKDELIVDVGYYKENGNPSTESVISFFREQGLTIKDTCFEDFDEFKKRGLVRNRQLKECATEWLLFSDSDMVYSSIYFERLLDAIDPAFQYIYTTGRMSTTKEVANDVIFKHSYPSIIDNPFGILENVQMEKKRHRSVGAGFSQLINYKSCNHLGFYVDPEGCADWSWDSKGKRKGQRARSDVQFRKHIKRNAQGDYSLKKLDDWFNKNQIHLNHARDKELGYHLEAQR